MRFSKPTSIFLLGFCLLGGMNLSHANSNPDCNVPICDMNSALDALKNADQKTRYETIQGYIGKAKRSTDVPTLQNFYDFAVAAKQILIEAHEEKWIIEASSYLAGACLDNLGRYSDVNATTLSKYYTSIKSEKGRADLLDFWKGRLKEFEDEKSLIEIAKYFSNAASISKADEDYDYIIDNALSNEQLVNTKLMRLHPVFEGVYNLKTNCESDNGETCSNIAFDKVIITDSISFENIKVSFVNSGLGVQLYGFSDVKMTKGVSSFDAVSSNAGTDSSVAKLHFYFDTETRSISGYLKTPDSQTNFSATLDMSNSPSAFFDMQDKRSNPTPVPATIFDTTLTGQFGSETATLRVKSFDEEHVGATLTVTSLGGVRIKYQTGRFFPKTGILVLVGGYNGGSMKMTLAFRKNAKTNRVDAIGVNINSANGSTNNVNFAAVSAE